MSLEKTEDRGVLVVRLLAPRLDAEAASDLREQLGPVVDGQATRLILDLSGVDFVDSLGLGSMLSLLRRMAPTGRLVLSGCRPQVEQVVRLTRLDRVLLLRPDLDQAFAAVADNPRGPA